MQHPWMKSFEWQKLIAQQLEAPYVPEPNADNFDEQHANHEKTLSPSEQDDISQKKVLLRRNSIQDLFNGYFYDYQKQKRAVQKI